MKKYLLHLAYGLAGIGAFIVSPAHAVIAGGMTANHYYYPASTTANADGLYGYDRFDSSIRVTHEPGNNGNTYYASQFFWTINVNQGGYTGIQQNSKKTKTVLFSIFGQTYDSSVDKPGSSPGAVCQGYPGRDIRFVDDSGMFVAHPYLGSQLVGQKDIRFGEGRIEVVVEFEEGIDIIFHRVVFLVVIGIRIFGSEADGAKRS